MVRLDFTSALVVFAVLAPLVQAASLQQVTEDFGSNPTNVGFYIYVPDTLAAKPPILVDPHWCHGDASAAYAGSQYATLASQYGFIVIYPDSPNTADKCWDVSSNATLTHNGGGDSLGIANMVRWTLSKYNGDASRVFVTGVSSGAMMTNVLIGSYPDIFAAGSAFAGVPFGCFAGDGYGVWSDACAKGLITHTPAEWAAIVKAAYPGYSGWRPKMQVFHGTSDEVLNYTNFLEEIKEWTAVLGLSQTPVSTTPDTPLTGWTKYVYGSNDWFEAYSAAGVSHNIPNQEAVVMSFFDLTCTSSNCFKWGSGSTPPVSSATTSTRTATTTSSAAVTSSTAKTTTTTAVSSSASTLKTSTTTSSTGACASGVPVWGQCGGMNWSGSVTCASCAKCVFVNDWYSQCLPQ